MIMKALKHYLGYGEACYVYTISATGIIVVPVLRIIQLYKRMRASETMYHFDLQ